MQLQLILSGAFKLWKGHESTSMYYNVFNYVHIFRYTVLLFVLFFERNSHFYLASKNIK